MTHKIGALKVATPYAEAFLQLGLSLYQSTGKSEVFFQLIYEMQDLLKAFADSPDFAKYLSHPVYSPEEKKLLLKNGLGQKLSQPTLEFLNLLVEKKRIGLLPSIGYLFLEKAYDFVGLRFVEVWSTVKLSQAQEESLKQKMAFTLGPLFTTPFVQKPNVQLLLHIDPSILGGLVIKVGSKVLDLSILGDLKRLEKVLTA